MAFFKFSCLPNGKVATHFNVMNRYYKRTRYLMGSPFELTVSGKLPLCADAVESAFQEIARIETVFTVFRPDSPLSRFNLSKKKGCAPLDKEILDVLCEAIHYARISDGGFDPTAGQLIDLWGFGALGAKKEAPSKTVLQSALRSVGHRYLKMHKEKGTVERLREGLCVNLGGIVKGYAIDRAVQILKQHKISHGLVSCGSTLYGFGRPGWRTGIQHPRNIERVINGVILSDQALATSGDYERYFYADGKRYSHLIDPRTGVPVSGMASVSVIAKTAMAADALSTAVFVLGADSGRRFLKDQPNLEGLIVSEDRAGSLHVSKTPSWPAEPSSRLLGRRDFLTKACAIFLGTILLFASMRPRETEAASIRFATEKEALRRMIPSAERFDVEQVILSKVQLAAAQKLAGKGFRKKNYSFWVGRRGDKAVGYALKLNVIGKKRPITFLIAIAPDGSAKGLEVLIYRESRGSEVRFERFTNQFKRKTTEDPLRLDRDIRPISGATLSSRAAAYAVRKALGIFEVVYKKNGLE